MSLVEALVVVLVALTVLTAIAALSCIPVWRRIGLLNREDVPFTKREIVFLVCGGLLAMCCFLLVAP